MTEICLEIKIDVKKSSVKLCFECKGHCEHDVCVSVSALVSTLVEIISSSPANSKEPEITYEFGNVEIKAEFNRLYYECLIRQKIEAVMLGLRMFESNYPDEIKIECGGVVFEEASLL